MVGVVLTCGGGDEVVSVVVVVVTVLLELSVVNRMFSSGLCGGLSIGSLAVLWVCKNTKDGLGRGLTL